MDIKSAMPKFGFGHRKTRHIVIDHDGELWIAAAPVAVGGFLPMGMTSLPGVLRVEPVENGAAAPFSYTATESILELTTGSGAKVRFAIDADAGALRITGNTDFRLDGVSAASRISTLATDNGAILDSGASHFVFTAIKGNIRFDDTWLLHEMRATTPVIDVKTENGEFEICMFDLPADTATPPVTKTFDECAASSGAEFKAFTDTLVETPAEWDDVREKAAYPLWLCHRVLDGKHEVIVENKYDSKNTNAWLMAISSLAFTDAAMAVDMLLAYPVGLPPVAGIAAARLIDDGMLCDSRDEIYKVYSALEATARKCVKKRSLDNNGLSFYMYRFESGQEKSPEFFNAGEPVFAPDLNAYLIIVSEVLGRLAHMEYDIGVGNKWEAHAKALKAQLIAELWDGEDFIAKNAYSGVASGPDKFLSLVPIILGSRLPEEIIRKLASKIDEQAVDSAIGLLLIGGLYDAGEKEAAKELAIKALTGARADGFRKPFYAASLLALAHKVLL